MVPVLYPAQHSKLAFCHNDAQVVVGDGAWCDAADRQRDARRRSRGLLPRELTPSEGNRISLIDFEYAGLNPASFDIANCWCEIASTIGSATESVTLGSGLLNGGPQRVCIPV